MRQPVYGLIEILTFRRLYDLSYRLVLSMAGPRTSPFSGGCGTLPWTLRSGSLLGGPASIRRAAFSSSGRSLLGKRPGTGSLGTLFLQRFFPCLAAGLADRLMPPALFRLPTRIFPCLFRNAALLRLRHIYARPPRFGQPDGNGLFGITGSMLALTYIVYLLTNELACLCAARFSLLLIAPGALNGCFVWHNIMF